MPNQTKPVLVTGVAGFIGFHLANKLLAQGFQVVGVDNLNDYYDVQLKRDRLNALHGQYSESGLYTFHEYDIADSDLLEGLFHAHQFDFVLHMAAQAGVRYSIDKPATYTHSNLVVFSNILECCRQHHVKHLLFASSSSVYGNQVQSPFSEDMPTDSPVSYYAATKKSNEVMAHAYASLYGIKITGVRLFTVYGPWGRPDMAPMIFLRKLMANEPIHVYNHGQMQRDFTYIDDAVNAILALLEMSQSGSRNPSHDRDLFEIFNVASGCPVSLMDFVAELERQANQKALIVLEEMQMGDVRSTHASIEKLQACVSYEPSYQLSSGLTRFIKWYHSYYQHRTRVNAVHSPSKESEGY